MRNDNRDFCRHCFILPSIFLYLKNCICYYFILYFEMLWKPSLFSSCSYSEWLTIYQLHSPNTIFSCGSFLWTLQKYFGCLLVINIYLLEFKWCPHKNEVASKYQSEIPASKRNIPSVCIYTIWQSCVLFYCL